MSNPAPMPSYWALAEEVTHLHGHLDKLKAENAELRRELAVSEPLFETLNAANDGLLAENAKLRELVEYMHRCYVIGHDWGPYGAPEQHWVEERMRELGVEV